MIDISIILDIAKNISEDTFSSDTKKEYEQRYSLKSLPPKLNNPSEIKQGFLFQKPSFNLRVREEKFKDDIKYTLTCKFYDKNDEAEVEITKEMFNKLWPETLSETRMEKTRYRYLDFEIDDIHSPKDKKGIVAEIETDKKDTKIKLPDSFEVIKRLQ